MSAWAAVKELLDEIEEEHQRELTEAEVSNGIGNFGDDPYPAWVDRVCRELPAAAARGVCPWPDARAIVEEAALELIAWYRRHPEEAMHELVRRLQAGLRPRRRTERRQAAEEGAA